jgi:hypothetical protein
MRNGARILVGLGAVVSLLAAAGRLSSGAGANKERRYFNARLGVGLEAPTGWSLSLHTGYGNVLATLLHPGGSRISLAVDRTKAKDAAALAADSRPGLAAQGMTVDRVAPGPRGGVLLEARLARRSQALRQLYVVRDLDAARGDRQAVVLTLSTSAAELAAASPSFDWAIAHLDLEAPVHPDEKPSDKPDAGR